MSNKLGNHRFEVVIEVPRGSFLKRGADGRLDFISPFPCPFNYGSIHSYVGGEGDLLDALVLGPRLSRDTRIEVTAWGAVGLTDRSMYDDKLVCSQQPLRADQQRWVVRFFHFYAWCKRVLNWYRGERGRTVCEGWQQTDDALARAVPRLPGLPLRTPPKF